MTNEEKKAAEEQAAAERVTKEKVAKEKAAPKKAETTPVKDTSDTGKVNIQKKAEQIFKSYPKAQELFFTADGTAFFKKSNAQSHATILKEKEIKTIKR